MKVKICGIRSLASAQAAIDAGAEFIGFNFVPTSKRYIDPNVCQIIIDQIRGEIKIVGVFKNAAVDEVNNLARQLGLDYVQLHGEEDDEYIKQIDAPVIKSSNGIQNTTYKHATFLLLDRKEQGQGSMVAVDFAKYLAKRNEIFYAGGLTPDNVIAIIEIVKPYAVDVAGGIETNGKEDVDKIKAFIANAKGVTL